MNKTVTVIFILLIAGLGIFVYVNNKKPVTVKKSAVTPTPTVKNLNPLSLEYMRSQSYPGSAITIEQTLDPGSNYQQYIASYKSDGLKIYALLTIPDGKPSTGGWPAIVFNHGYIPPAQYTPTNRYIAYVAALARSGYVVFKPDYRGNGQSQGTAAGSYYSPGYTIDVLNALASIKKYPNVNPNRIGMWGHSMGGNITLRALEIAPDIKAAVIWGGVVGSYNDLMNNWQHRVTYRPPPSELANRNSGRQNLIKKYGTPQQNPAFWNSIDPNYNVQFINTPVQLDQGLADEEVPAAFSLSLYDRLTKANKTVELYTYPGADHNISGPSFDLAMERTISFFDKYLK